MTIKRFAIELNSATVERLKMIWTMESDRQFRKMLQGIVDAYISRTITGDEKRDDSSKIPKDR